MNTRNIPESLTDRYRSLARAISIVENEASGYRELLESAEVMDIPVIGITGPPGSGKSSILNSLLREDHFQGKHICVIAVDPSSPFNFGALLGDRIRVEHLADNNKLYFRSIASRGSLGGLSDKIIEIIQICKSYPFDYIFVETVGVGQSEVEIAGLADITCVVLTPESGDQVQSMKAGLMEIADMFIVNKCDLPHAASFINNLKQVLALKNNIELPIVELSATNGEGIESLISELENQAKLDHNNIKRYVLLAEKIFRIIQKRRMEVISKESILKDLKKVDNISKLNAYQYVKSMYSDLLDL